MLPENNLVPHFLEDDWIMWTPREELRPLFAKVQAEDEVYLQIKSNGNVHTYGS
ncbi:hypothetical protein [Paenibacillus psychroresistens]|uniref:hypothetical protein n=1 Tax=Paenibacillus psychroresistens TaxID=1778678 RepID=UPI0012DA5717|nr:hypothetical protein [Paenibacillus psychroresistens]